MNINVIIFGQLVDITGSNSISLTGITDTDQLVKTMNEKFPAFTDAKYVIAVNRKVINGNTNLQENNTIALLPPFSGG
jgi:sulfur-carrier protein